MLFLDQVIDHTANLVHSTGKLKAGKSYTVMTAPGGDNIPNVVAAQSTLAAHGNFTDGAIFKVDKDVTIDANSPIGCERSSGKWKNL